MAGVAGNAFKAALLSGGINKALQDEDLELILFKNNYTPLEDDVEGDYTEADFSGYAPIVLAGASWTVTPGAPALAQYAEQTFEADDVIDPAQLIYGYAAFYETARTFAFAEKFASPVSVAAAGDVPILITPRIRAYTKA